MFVQQTVEFRLKNNAIYTFFDKCGMFINV